VVEAKIDYLVYKMASCLDRASDTLLDYLIKGDHRRLDVIRRYLEEYASYETQLNELLKAEVEKARLMQSKIADLLSRFKTLLEGLSK